MAETVFAGEQVEELPAGQGRGMLALPFAVFAWFAKDFFMCDRPTHAGNGYCQQNQDCGLVRQSLRNHFWCHHGSSAHAHCRNRIFTVGCALHH
jgi:hypothetical protein